MPRTELHYFDESFLYLSASLRLLPFSNDEDVTKEFLKDVESGIDYEMKYNSAIRKLDKNGEYGYVFKVDGYIPKELQDYMDSLSPSITRVVFTEFSNFEAVNYRNRNDFCRLSPHLYPLVNSVFFLSRLQQMIDLVLSLQKFIRYIVSYKKHI